MDGAEKGVVFDIDHFAVHDGPGIRATVYLKGCPLRCAWCHSPESQAMKAQLLYAGGRCVGCGACVEACAYGAQRMTPAGHVFARERCAGCFACAKECPSNALLVSGREMTVAQVLGEVLPDKPFFDNSGGGVTLTGGEALSQADFAAALLCALKERGVHTIVETSGYGRQEALLSLARAVDVFYFDFKLWDAKQFFDHTGGDVRVVRRNLRALCRIGARIVLRFAMIPGVTTARENIAMLMRTAAAHGIDTIHLLPYNAAAPEKYDWLKRPFPLGALTMDLDETVRTIREMAPPGVNAILTA